ncbi:DNA polymerase III subunit chi [Pseudomonas sp. RTB3]|uniref:DNA polymerase III subunit chi n=1 Tax=unclassified Pseudomonas TaxID=196821 RepID=UPI002B23CD6B|nr:MULTISPECIES: DNA polymerase III subunit chi [unclassified Pseudomonas]MEB0008963.1 DNA polymerase III subunit chi [Pseudomonas sp. RTB2]MEB0015410.1 DNA polymerase III subunit chi [Pseudomonas sp. RTB3]MEB0272137.1 DNA polymerase III subunit chi [Pseudomonas sp. 5B4]
MDTQKPLKDSAHLLDDLESIRQLLGDDSLQPPLLTDSVTSDVQIPLLFNVVGAQATAHTDTDDTDSDADEADIPTLTPEPPATQPEPVSANPDRLLHLESELRAAAQLIMQDVIDDFAPHIETEIKRRLDARMERLLSQYQG